MKPASKSILFLTGFISSLILIYGGCLVKPSAPPPAQSAAMTQAPNAGTPLPTPMPRTPQDVRTPLPPPTIDRTPQPPSLTPSHDYENYTLDSVFPGGSTTFDPFTYGRPGSPYGPGELFAPGIGTARCGPMDLPMSAQFADPGDTQAVIIVVGNGLECIPDIDHDKPGAAITFQFIGAPFTNPPWTIRALTATLVTITNGTVTLRFEFSITRETTFITRVEYL